MAKKSDGKAAKAATKSATYQHLAEVTGLSRKQVAGFFDELANLIKKEVGKKGPGVFTVPGLLKIKCVKNKATLAARAATRRPAKR